jgi:hypothetical protein
MPPLLPIAFALGYFITGNFKDKTESIDKYYIKEEVAQFDEKKKSNWEDLMHYTTNQLKSLQPTEKKMTAQCKLLPRSRCL